MCQVRSKYQLVNTRTQIVFFIVAVFPSYASSSGLPPLIHSPKPLRTAAKAKLEGEAPRGSRSNGAGRRQGSKPYLQATPPGVPMMPVKFNKRHKDSRASDNSAFPKIAVSSPSLNAVRASWRNDIRSLPSHPTATPGLMDEDQTHWPGPSRWKCSQHLLKVDEIEVFVELLNALHASRVPFLGNTLFIADSQVAQTAEELAKLDWSIKDDTIWVSVTNSAMYLGYINSPRTLKDKPHEKNVLEEPHRRHLQYPLRYIVFFHLDHEASGLHWTLVRHDLQTSLSSATVAITTLGGELSYSTAPHYVITSFFRSERPNRPVRHAATKWYPFL